MIRETILFDINETVLSLDSLQQPFTEVFGDRSVLNLWFSKLLHASVVCVATDVKSDFAALASIMLDNVAAISKVDLSKESKKNLLGCFASLAPHPDVVPALQHLKDHGFRIIALSNSSSALINSQLTNSALLPLFDRVISVEETGSFKPNSEVYKHAAKQVGISLNQLRLVATHDWDTHGALSAGMKAAYIDRNGTPYNPLYKQPDIQAKTMMEIADLIINKTQISTLDQ